MTEPRTELMKLGGLIFLIAGILWLSGNGSQSFRFRFLWIDSHIIIGALFFFNSLVFFIAGSPRLKKRLQRLR